MDLTISQYQLNQNYYKQLPAMTYEQIEEKREIISQFLMPHIYFLLLNNDLHYYTFIENEYDNLDDLIDLVTSLGKLKAIEFNEDAPMIEFWVERDDECHMYGLIEYSKGWIEI